MKDYTQTYIQDCISEIFEMPEADQPREWADEIEWVNSKIAAGDTDIIPAKAIFESIAREAKYFA